MIFSQCARRTTLRLTSLHGVGGGGPLRRYARLVGAPNYAPSLRSVAGLLLALALESACEDTLTSLHRSVTARAFPPRAHFGLFGDYAVPHAQVAPSRQGGISLPDGLRGSPRAQAREQLDVNGLR